ncbi:unnamed protein product [Urochloa humidicola]
MGLVRHLRCRSRSLAEFVVTVVLLVGVGGLISEVSANKINLPPPPLSTIHRRPPSHAFLCDLPSTSVAMVERWSPHPALMLGDAALGHGPGALLGIHATTSTDKQAGAGAPCRAGLHHRRRPPQLLVANMEVAKLLSTFGQTSDFNRCWSSDLTMREVEPSTS